LGSARHGQRCEVELVQLGAQPAAAQARTETTPCLRSTSAMGAGLMHRQ
jgi:hypothetical protein